jgi:hypothetical protein
METFATAPPNPLHYVDAAPVPDTDHGGFKAFGEDGPTFFDILDIINPLQHIPIVSTLYRAITGDAIDPVPRVAGGALFGGLIGAVSSLVNVVIDELTGNDLGEHVLALFEGEGGAAAEPDAPATGVAQASFVTAAGEDREPPSAAVAAGLYRSPVSAHIGVLEWARGEAAFMTANANTNPVGPTIDIRA